jgi:hypothetical protein
MSTQIQKLTATVLTDLSDVRQSFRWLDEHSAEIDRKKETTFGDFITSLLLLANAGLSIYNTIEDGKRLIATIQTQQRLEAALQARQWLLSPTAIKVTTARKKQKAKGQRGTSRRVRRSSIDWSALAKLSEQS